MPTMGQCKTIIDEIYVSTIAPKSYFAVYSKCIKHKKKGWACTVFHIKQQQESFTSKQE